MRLAVVDGGLEQRRIATIGDRGDHVVQLAVGPPHLARLADHRRHRGIDDHVARHVEIGDAAIGVDHGEAGAPGVLGLDVGLDRGLLGLGQGLDAGHHVAHAVVGIDAQLLQGGAMLLEHVGEEHRHAMAEQDGIGDLHHGRLDVQREQNAVLLRGLDLGREEGIQFPGAHHRAVDDLARLEGNLRLQHRRRAILDDQLDAGIGRRRNRRRDFRPVEVAVRHVRHARLGVLAPGTHLVRVLARVLLHGAGGAAVGIALAQHRIDGAAQHLAVTGADFLVRRRRVAVRIVRHVVALVLQLLDRGLELRDRGRDIRQLDDVGLRLHRQFAECCEFVVDLLLGLQLVGEVGEDAAGQRNVRQLHRHAGRCHEGRHDRQQGICCQPRGLINLRPDDFEIRHISISVRAFVSAELIYCRLWPVFLHRRKGKAISGRTPSPGPPFDQAFLGRGASRIIDEVRGINRVTYDIASKLSVTIEWFVAVMMRPTGGRAVFRPPCLPAWPRGPATRRQILHENHVIEIASRSANPPSTMEFSRASSGCQ